jgi:hypothetical protein
MTVADMLEHISSEEISEWIEFYRLEAEAEKNAIEKGRQETRHRGR